MLLETLASKITKEGVCVYQGSSLPRWEEAIARSNFARAPRIERCANQNSFRVQLDKVVIGDVDVIRRQSGASHSVVTSGTEGRVIATIPVAGAGRVTLARAERELTPAAGAVDGGTSGFTRFEAGDDMDWLTVVVPRVRVERICAGLMGKSEPTKVEFFLNFPVGTTGWVELLMSAVSASKIASRHVLVRKNLEQLLIAGMVLQLPNNFSEKLRASGRQAEPKSVKRAIAFMEDRLDQPITISEVTAHIGVSMRGLQLAFQKCYGCSPTQWLRERRLELAHAALVNGETTVTEVAFAWGFNDLSAFAKLYRERFKCLPSETLRDKGPRSN